MADCKYTLNKKQCELLIMLQELSKIIKQTNPYLVFFEDKSEKTFIDLFFTKNRKGECRLNTLLKQAELPCLSDSINQVLNDLSKKTYHSYAEINSKKQSEFKNEDCDCLSSFNRFKDESIKMITNDFLTLSDLIDNYVNDIQKQYCTVFFK